MIGGEIVIAEFLPEQKWRRSEDRMFPTSPGANSISLSTAVLLVIKSQVATDPFFFSDGFDAGALECLILGVILMLCTQFSMYLFSRSWQYGKAYSYGEVWSCTFGPRFAFLPTALLILLYVCFNMDGSWESNENTLFLMAEYWPDYPELFDNPWVIEMIVAAIFVLPCGLVGRFSDLVPIAYIGVFSVLAGVVCMAIALVRDIDELGFAAQNQLFLFGRDLPTAVGCAQAFNVVFFFHPFLTFIFRDLGEASISRCLKTCWFSNGLTFALMYLGGLMSFFMYKDNDLEDNCFEWMNLRRPEAAIGLGASMIAAACSLAYFCAYISRLCSTLVLGQGTTNVICIFVGVLVCVFCYMFLMFIEDKIYYTVYMLGDFCAILLVFVIPPAYYLAQFKGLNMTMAIGSVILIVAGVAFGGLLFWIALPDLLEVWQES
jgi:hypothetical protein